VIGQIVNNRYRIVCSRGVCDPAPAAGGTPAASEKLIS